jgi:hypothetical protein
MDLVMIPVVLLVVALLLQPYAQRKREEAIVKRLKEAQNATEAEATIDAAIGANQQTVKRQKLVTALSRLWFR